ncbi:hypothetical protein [Kitasatospora sp. NPDC005751]|uniref:hypothetical protein n=1 Tax=unclassified Kitasatospora TaxID=2633591 RepID=UPI0033CC2A70
MTTSLPRPPKAVGAVYLRCYPFDQWEMADHRAAVSSYAEGLGFCGPHVFLDNGCPSVGELPRLAQLITLAEFGHCQTVFVPGLWVFSLDDAAAAATVKRLQKAGCRVVEMPSPRAATTGRPGRGPRARGPGTVEWVRAPAVVRG